MPKELQLGGRRMMAAVGQPCPYCSRTMTEATMYLEPTRDHILPRSKYGPKGRRAGRYIIVCSSCNFMKADMTLEEFIVYLAAKNEDLLRHIETNVDRMRNIRYLLDIGLE